MRFYYDLHIHSALSPCADEDMTPNNILNMAKIKGLDFIAITDHNSCKNVMPCTNIGRQLGILVIPGMELQTKEDVHVLCLFKNINDAFNFQDFIYSRLPNMKNKSDLFGKQLIYDEYDEIIGEEDRLLLTSTYISFDEAYNKVKNLNGLFIPSHIDKDNFSVIANLGFIPDYLEINTVEYTDEQKIEKLKRLGILKEDLKFIKNSDAHHLGDISEKENYIDIDKLTIDNVFNVLSRKW